MKKRDMTILIPTHRRINRQITLAKIPRRWRSNVVLVPSHEEYEAHRQKFVKKYQVWKPPATVKSIAQKRRWILEECHRRGIEKIMMLDDDLYFARRHFTDDPDGSWTFKLLKATEDDLDWGLRKVAAMLDEVAHSGFAPRGGNHGLKTHRTWNPNFRAIYCLAYNVPIVIRHCKLGRIEHREDMELTLQLLTKGFPNKILLELVSDQTYNAMGGASTERSVEASNADADKLVRMYPKFVKAVDREYKQSLPRREVVVAWKKAYEYGRLQRGKGVRD